MTVSHKQKVVSLFLIGVVILLGLSWVGTYGQVVPSLPIEYDKEVSQLVLNQPDSKPQKITSIMINGKAYDIEKGWLRGDLQGVSGKETLASFYRGETVLRNAVNQPSMITTEQGKTLPLTFRSRKLSEYRQVFWLSRISASIMIFFSLWVYAIAPLQKGAIAALVGSYCFAVGFLLADTSIDRLWAINPTWFYLENLTASAMTVIYTTSIFYLAWHLPKPLFSHRLYRYVPVMVFVLLSTLLLLGFFQVINNVVITFELPYVVVHILVLFILIYKFCYHFITRRHNILDWVSMRWVMLATVFGISIPLGCHVMVYMGHLKNLPPFAIDSIIVFKVGLSALVASSVLYQIESAWWRIWQVILGLAAFVIAMIYTLQAHLSKLVVVGLSLAVTMFVVWLVKFWFSRSLALSPSRLVEENLHSLLLVGNEPQRTDMSWKTILQRVMQPLEMTLVTKSQVHQQACYVADGGSALYVPSLNPQQQIKLSGATKGLRLFTLHDVKLVASFWEVIKQAQQSKQAFTEGEVRERQRIAADLHDDIGGKLLYLSSADGEYGEYARDVLQDLRTLTRGLGGEEKTLADVFADMVYAFSEQAESNAVDFIPQITLGESEAVHLTTTSSTLLSVVMHELLRNAFKHKDVSIVKLSCESIGDSLHVRVENNGEATVPDNWKIGLGITNMRRRVHDVQGNIHWLTDAGWIQAIMTLPIINLQADPSEP